MAGADNLKGKGFESRSTEEVREIASKGGKNSGASRRRKKTMKASAQMLLELPVTEKLKRTLTSMGIDEEDTNYQTAVLVAMMKEALAGNVKAAAFLQDLIGENPKQELQKKELKLRQDEFNYRKEQDALRNGAQECTETLADAIIEAYQQVKEEGGEDESADG